MPSAPQPAGVSPGNPVRGGGLPPVPGSHPEDQSRSTVRVTPCRPPPQVTRSRQPSDGGCCSGRTWQPGPAIYT